MKQMATETAHPERNPRLIQDFLKDSKDTPKPCEVFSAGKAKKKLC